METKNILTWPGGKLDFGSGTLIMGILNVTPDSFSDGGQFFDIDKAVAHGLVMAKAGASIIDIGPESTRPGSVPVSTQEQINRAIPVIEKLGSQTSAIISIDTSNPEVADAALKAGAAMINDVTALSNDQMVTLAAQSEVPVVLMHMQSKPKNMQDKPHYSNVVDEVLEYLLVRAEYAQNCGIDKGRIFIDPGIGFGKTTEHNLELLRNIDKFVGTGFKILVGTSRKRFLGELTGKEKPTERAFGTASTVALCVKAGVSIVRVHDVAQMIDVIKVTKAIK